MQLGTLAAVLLLGLVVVLLFGWKQQRPAAPPAVAEAARPEFRLRAVRPEAPPTVAPLPPMPPPDSAPASPAGSLPLELCGVGRVPGATTATLNHLPPHLGDQAWDALLPRVLAALDAGGTRQRVAARVLLAADAPLPERERLAQEALALVQASADGPAAAWVTGLCAHSVRSCLPAAARAWTAAEPGNAAAWVALADGDGQTRRESVLAAARATEYRGHWAVLAATAQQAVPDDALAYLRALVAGRAIVVDSLFTPMPFQLLQHCRETPNPDCEALARLMSTRADSLIGLSLGASLGRAQGWPEAELAALKTGRDALQAAEALPGREQPLGCTAVRAMADAVQQMARDGELAFLRQRQAAGR